MSALSPPPRVVDRAKQKLHEPAAPTPRCGGGESGGISEVGLGVQIPTFPGRRRCLPVAEINKSFQGMGGMGNNARLSRTVDLREWKGHSDSRADITPFKNSL